MKRYFLVLFAFLLVFSMALPLSAHSASDYEYYPKMENLNVPQEYVDLYTRIHAAAYWGEKVTFETLEFSDVWGFSQILFMELYRDGLITKPEVQAQSPDIEDNPEAPRIPYDEVKRVFERCFGPNTFEIYLSDQQNENYFISDNINILSYEKSTHSFVFIYFSWKGSNSWGIRHEKFLYAEEHGDEIYLFMKYGSYSCTGDQTSATIYGDAKKACRNEEGVVLGTGGEIAVKEPESVYNRFFAGEFDEYLPVYKHTFKDNGNGGYYWYSTEMAEAGTPIPTEQFSEKQEDNSAEGNSTPEDSTEGNHTVLGGNWGSTSSQPPATDTDAAPKPEGTPTWGIVVGWIAVAAALGVGVVLLLKRYWK